MKSLENNWSGMKWHSRNDPSGRVSESTGMRFLTVVKAKERSRTETYSATEVYGAFEELVEWVDTGVAPTP